MGGKAGDDFPTLPKV